eukprot:680670_1
MDPTHFLVTLSICSIPTLVFSGYPISDPDTHSYDVPYNLIDTDPECFWSSACPFAPGSAWGTFPNSEERFQHILHNMHRMFPNSSLATRLGSYAYGTWGHDTFWANDGEFCGGRDSSRKPLMWYSPANQMARFKQWDESTCGSGWYSYVYPANHATHPNEHTNRHMTCGWGTSTTSVTFRDHTVDIPQDRCFHFSNGTWSDNPYNCNLEYRSPWFCDDNNNIYDNCYFQYEAICGSNSCVDSSGHCDPIFSTNVEFVGTGFVAGTNGACSVFDANHPTGYLENTHQLPIGAHFDARMKINSDYLRTDGKHFALWLEYYGWDLETPAACYALYDGAIHSLPVFLSNDHAHPLEANNYRDGQGCCPEPVEQSCPCSSMSNDCCDDELDGRWDETPGFYGYDSRSVMFLQYFDPPENTCEPYAFLCRDSLGSYDRLPQENDYYFGTEWIDWGWSDYAGDYNLQCDENHYYNHDTEGWTVNGGPTLVKDDIWYYDGASSDPCLGCSKIEILACLEQCILTASGDPTQPCQDNCNGASAPTGVTSEPTSTTSAPTGVTPGPSALTRGPTSTTSAPTGVTPGPSALTRGPTSTTSAPTAATPGPSSAPVAEPTEITSEPTSTTSAPSGVTPGPSASTPGPTSITSAPSTPTDTPTTATSEPTAVTGSPTTATDAPSTAPTAATRSPTTQTGAPSAYDTTCDEGEDHIIQFSHVWSPRESSTVERDDPDWVESWVDAGRREFIADNPDCGAATESSPELEFFYRFWYSGNSERLGFQARVCCGIGRRLAIDYAVPSDVANHDKYVPNDAFYLHNPSVRTATGVDNGGQCDITNFNKVWTSVPSNPTNWEKENVWVEEGREAIIVAHPTCGAATESSPELEFFYRFWYSGNSERLGFQARVCCGIGRRLAIDYAVPSDVANHDKYVPNDAFYLHNPSVRTATGVDNGGQCDITNFNKVWTSVPSNPTNWEKENVWVEEGREAIIVAHPTCGAATESSPELEFFYRFFYSGDQDKLWFRAHICCGLGRRFGPNYEVPDDNIWTPNQGKASLYGPNEAYDDHNAAFREGNEWTDPEQFGVKQYVVFSLIGLMLIGCIVGGYYGCKYYKKKKKTDARSQTQSRPSERDLAASIQMHEAPPGPQEAPQLQTAGDESTDGTNRYVSQFLNTQQRDSLQITPPMKLLGREKVPSASYDRASLVEPATFAPPPRMSSVEKAQDMMHEMDEEEELDI